MEWQESLSKTKIQNHKAYNLFGDFVNVMQLQDPSQDTGRSTGDKVNGEAIEADANESQSSNDKATAEESTGEENDTEIHHSSVEIDKVDVKPLNWFPVRACNCISD